MYNYCVRAIGFHKIKIQCQCKFIIRGFKEDIRLSVVNRAQNDVRRIKFFLTISVRFHYVVEHGKIISIPKKCRTHLGVKRPLSDNSLAVSLPIRVNILIQARSQMLFKMFSV